MGARGRGFANGLTTGGKIDSSIVTNDSLTNFTSSPAGLSSAGNFTKITAATLSTTTNADFTFTGSYEEYMFYFFNIRPSATSEADMLFNFSTDSGSSYNTAIQSATHRRGTSSTQSLHQYYTGTDSQGGTTGQYFGFDMEHGTDSCLGGFLHVFDVHSTSKVKQFICETAFTHDSRTDHYNIGGYVNTTSALTNIRFFRDTGTYLDGTITMYGIS